MKTLVFFSLAFGLAQSLAFGAQKDTSAEKTDRKVKYRAAKDVNFDELLIQGQINRPDLFVVTGSANQGLDSLLRLRESFLDRTANELGEKEK
jgi:hypothetical protein